MKVITTQEYIVFHQKEMKKTLLNKGIFTSCQLKDGCAPWSIKSSKFCMIRKKRIKL